MLKLLLLLIGAAVLVDSCVNQKYVDSTGLDERTVYGWTVRTDKDYKTCYGIFIGPRVFLTASTCVNKNYRGQSITITNSIYDSKIMTTEIPVHHDNILTGEDINKGTTVFDRDIVLMITDEPVIPLNETTANSFVKLAKDINDVDFSKCFIEKVSTPPIIVRSPCQLKDENLTDNSIKEFYRYYEPEDIWTWQGNGLFCTLKKNSDVNVLAGYIGTNYVYSFGQRYFNNPHSIVNLSGLPIRPMNF